MPITLNHIVATCDKCPRSLKFTNCTQDRVAELLREYEWWTEDKPKDGEPVKCLCPACRPNKD